MECTINGKTKKEVLEGLRTPKETTKKLMNKYPYYSYDEFVERMNTVVGKENYVSEYISCETLALPTGQYMVSKSCVIKIYDDNGNEVPQLKVQGLGGNEIAYSDDLGSYVNLKNIPTLVKMNAFKDACKEYGIFGIHEMEEQSDVEKDKKSEKVTKPAERLTFCTNGKMIVTSIESKSNMPIYKISVNEFVQNALREKPTEIIFYPNQYKKCVDKLNSLVTTCEEEGRRVKLQLKVSQASWNKSDVPQMVFKDFW